MSQSDKGSGPLSEFDTRYADEAQLSDLIAQGWSFLIRNRRLLGVAALSGAVLSAALVMTTEPKYRSKLLVMVDPPLLSPLESSDQVKRDNSGFVDGQIYIINSRSVLEPVLDVAELYGTEEFTQPPPSLPARLIGGIKSALGGLMGRSEPSEAAAVALPESYALRLLRKHVSTKRKDDTNMIEITVTSNSSVRAARIANAVGDVFVENRQAAQFQKASHVLDWLDQRVLEIRQKLSLAEEEVASYRIAHDLISGDADATLNEQQLVELNTELIRSRAALSERRAAFARAQQLLADGGDIQALPQLQNSDIITTLRARLLELEQREAELRRMSNSDLRITSNVDEQRTVEAQLATEIQRMVAMMGHEVETLEAREALIATALADAGGRSGVENRNIVKLRELERVVQAYQALYERYIANAGIADEGVSELASGVEIIERASVANKPDYPPSKLFVIWGVMLGLALGIIIARLREILRPGFATITQVEQELQTPVIELLPRAPVGLDPLAAVLERPGSDYSAAMRAVRLRLTDPFGTQPAKTVMICAARNLDGADRIAAGLAGSAVLAGQRVLLVDADLRHSGLSRALGLQGRVGLTDMLAKKAQVAPTRFGGVDVIGAGQGKGPDDLLIGPEMQVRLQQWATEYDLIVLTAPALSECADGTYLAQITDASGFVVKWNATPKAVAAAGLARLPQAALRGIILGEVDLARARHFRESRLLHAQV